MVLFLAISGSIFQNTTVQKIGSALPNASPAEIMQLMTGTSSAVYMDLSESDKQVVIPQITDAMSNVWLMFLVAAALSFVCSLPLGVSNKFESSTPRGLSFMLRYPVPCRRLAL